MQNINSIIEVLHSYFAGNIMLLIALLAFVYFVWKNGKKVYLYVALVLAGLLFLFNGITYWLAGKVGEGETYYRMLWILPITVFAAYFVIELWHVLKGWKKVVFAALFLVLTGLYSKVSLRADLALPDNIYQLDEDVLQVADIIEAHSGGKRVSLLDDGSVSYSIRQYNENICDSPGSTYYMDVLLAMQNPNYTGNQIRQFTALTESDYIALQKEKIIQNLLVKDAGFVQIGASDHYNVYYVDQQKLNEEVLFADTLAEEDFKIAFREYVEIPGMEEDENYIYLVCGEGEPSAKRMESVLELVQTMQAKAVILNGTVTQEDAWVNSFAEELEKYGACCFVNDETAQVWKEDNILWLGISDTQNVSEQKIAEAVSGCKEDLPVILLTDSVIDNEWLSGHMEEALRGDIVGAYASISGWYDKTVLDDAYTQFAIGTIQDGFVAIITVKGTDE